MPELPEVETIKRVLSPQLVGQKIVDIRILDANAILFSITQGYMNTGTAKC